MSFSVYLQVAIAIYWLGRAVDDEYKGPKLDFSAFTALLNHHYHSDPRRASSAKQSGAAGKKVSRVERSDSGVSVPAVSRENSCTRSETSAEREVVTDSGYERENSIPDDQAAPSPPRRDGSHPPDEKRRSASRETSITPELKRAAPVARPSATFDSAAPTERTRIPSYVSRGPVSPEKLEKSARSPAFGRANASPEKSAEPSRIPPAPHCREHTAPGKTAVVERSKFPSFNRGNSLPAEHALDRSKIPSVNSRTNGENVDRSRIPKKESHSLVKEERTPVKQTNSFRQQAVNSPKHVPREQNSLGPHNSLAQPNSPSKAAKESYSPYKSAFEKRQYSPRKANEAFSPYAQPPPHASPCDLPASLRTGPAASPELPLADDTTPTYDRQLVDDRHGELVNNGDTSFDSNTSDHYHDEKLNQHQQQQQQHNVARMPARYNDQRHHSADSLRYSGGSYDGFSSEKESDCSSFGGGRLNPSTSQDSFSHIPSGSTDSLDSPSLGSHSRQSSGSMESITSSTAGEKPEKNAFRKISNTMAPPPSHDPMAFVKSARSNMTAEAAAKHKRQQQVEQMKKRNKDIDQDEWQTVSVTYNSIYAFWK